MKSKTILTIFWLIIGVPVLAQNSKIKRPESYNYLRGVEAVQSEKIEEALEYFNKDIQENPKNGYSFSWIAMLRAHGE